MRLLYARHSLLSHGFPQKQSVTRRDGAARHAVGAHLPLHRLCWHRVRTARSRVAASTEGLVIMDLGSAFAVSVLRQPHQEAIVDGERFETLLQASPIPGPSSPNEFSTCLMLYTSGTTGRPKGVPRSHRAELSASVSHIAQNQYRQGDSCLGVMPLFHTMGIRILLGSALLNGRFVCVPDYSPEEILRLVERKRLTTLYLVPTMFHDVLRHPDFARYDLSSLSRVGYAGMTMMPALIERCLEQLKPDLFVNYYGSSEIYTFTYCDHLERKP